MRNMSTYDFSYFYVFLGKPEILRYSQIMFHKFRVLPGLCMFFLLFQFENTPGTTFLLDTRRNAEKKVGFETPSFSCAYFWELKFDPGGEEKEEEEGTERWGSFFSEETIYRS